MVRSERVRLRTNADPPLLASRMVSVIGPVESDRTID